LAELSKTWFDLPDGANLEHGGWGWAPISARKPQCPGDFTSPSRYTFSPNPGSAATDYGRQQGRAVREAVGLFVARFRGHENQLKGSLSKAMFAAIPDDGQLARTLAGVMMGFLPTVDGILRSVLFEWMDDKSLWRLQEALASDADSDRHAAAKRVLKVPLMRAMQRRPVPDLVWRTAVKDHHLGSEHIKTGDTIVLGIGSATQEELDAGHVNVAPIFGGIRKSPPPAPVPTHACPAYDMAIGVLLGILSALLDAGTLRPTPSPTGLELTGK